MSEGMETKDKGKRPMSRRKLLGSLLAAGISGTVAGSIIQQVFGAPSGNPRETGEDYISFIDRALYNTGSMLKATALSGVEGRYISRTSLELIMDADVDAAAGIVRSKLAEATVADHPSVPACRAYATGTQSIPTSTVTPILFNTELFDTDTMHDTGSNTSRITAKTAGYYSIVGYLPFSIAAVGRRIAFLLLNGGTYIDASEPGSIADGTSSPQLKPSTIYHLAVNDYVELVGYQSTAGALNTTVSEGPLPYLAAIWLT